MLLKAYFHNTTRHPFSRSYGANLPSSLMIIISTPEHSQPVYLCRFAVRSPYNIARGFSSQCGVNQTYRFFQIDMPITLQISDFADLPTKSSFVLSLASIRQVNLPSCVSPSLKRCLVVQEYLTCCPSPTPTGLGLGID